LNYKIKEHQKTNSTRLNWIDYKDLYWVNKVAEGGYGTIYSAYWVGSSIIGGKQKHVALKSFRDSCNMIESFFHEVRF